MDCKKGPLGIITVVTNQELIGMILQVVSQTASHFSWKDNIDQENPSPSTASSVPPLKKPCIGDTRLFQRHLFSPHNLCRIEAMNTSQVTPNRTSSGRMKRGQKKMLSAAIPDAPWRLNGLMLESRHRPPHHCPSWDLTAAHISPRLWKCWEFHQKKTWTSRNFDPRNPTNPHPNFVPVPVSRLNSCSACCSMISTVSRSPARRSRRSSSVARKLGSINGASNALPLLSCTVPRLVGRMVPQCAW